jgi:hypothetical protein
VLTMSSPQETIGAEPVAMVTRRLSLDLEGCLMVPPKLQTPSAPKGRRHVAWGQSVAAAPGKTKIRTSKAPKGRRQFRSEASCRRPFRAYDRYMGSASPGLWRFAPAPGYMPSPLRDGSLSGERPRVDGP